MMKKHGIISLVLAAMFSLGIWGNINALTAISACAASNKRVISDAEELLRFAEECRIDSASRGIEVTLSADISLAGKSFDGIPIFCGTFDGGGHIVSGLSITNSGSQAGLFRYLERGAVVKDLKVSGTVAPSGSAVRVGGIVGVNRGKLIGCEFSGSVSGKVSVGGLVGENAESGVISRCGSAAAISGENTVGGIAGNNLGVIMDCSNSGNVNAVYSDTEPNVDELETDEVTAAEVVGKTDIGGISGYSSGIIQRCENSGTVGYQHTGYNIGGIVGRQCGMLYSCKNAGRVYGRKDIGGIAGQMEPFRSIEFSEDAAQRLAAETDILSECADKLIVDLRGSGDKLNSEIQSLTNQMNEVQKSADIITNRAENVFNGYSDGINEILSRADIALDDLPSALNELEGAVDLFGDFSEKCGDALKEIETAGEYSGGAIDAARDALKEFDDALPDIMAGIRDVGGAVGDIQRALGDPERIKQSLNSIMDSLDKITDKTSEIADAAKRLNAAFTELSDWLEGEDWQALKSSVSAFSDSMADVLAALGDLSGAVGNIAAAIDSEKMQDAFAELNSAAAALGNAAAKLASALNGGTVPDAEELRAAAEELQKAADDLQSASEHLNSAVDEAAMRKALDELQAAAEEARTALDNASEAASDMSDALARITGSTVPQDTMDTVSEQMNVILGSISDISEDLADIGGEVRRILEEIDAAGLSEAMKTLGDSAEKIANAANSVCGAGDELYRASERLEKAAESVTSASSKAGEAADIMSEVSDKLSAAIRHLEEVTRALADKPQVRFPALDEAFTNATDSLSLNLKAMVSTLSEIGNSANADINVILDDVQAMNDSLNRIFEIFKDTYKDLLSEDDEERKFSEDISENDENSTQGKALSCVNNGNVEGDVNVGGITGAMAIEFDLDPEDDIAQNGDRSVNFSYNVLDKIESCENYGDITAKKNNCGGIVGKMDIGLVRNSRSGGTVTGSDGGYVGGIAGYSSAKVRGCAAKVSLAGTSYIGGIAGEGGIITDCLAICDIKEFTEKIGSLAGYVDFSKENTEVSGNFFVDRGVAGIDGVSYEGIAEPISYEEFARRVSGFADIVIEFNACGETLYRLNVPYGGRIGAEDIPEIPKKKGYFARWEEFDHEKITFPRTINAEYIPYVTAIESSAEDENGLALVIANGTFDDHSRLTVKTESSGVFAPEGGMLRLVTLDYEHYDDSEPLRLRFLGTGKSPRLMQYINGGWIDVEFTENGKYLIVDAPVLEGNSAYYCVLSGGANVALIVIAAAAVVAVINIVLVVILIKRRKKAKKKEEQSNT